MSTTNISEEKSPDERAKDSGVQNSGKNKGENTHKDNTSKKCVNDSRHGNNENERSSSEHEDDKDNNTDDETCDDATTEINDQSADHRNATALLKGEEDKNDINERPKFIKKVNAYGYEVFRIVQAGKGQPRGYIWDHYSDIVGDNRRGQCIYCGYKPMGAMRMRRHLQYTCVYVPGVIRQEIVELNNEYVNSKSETKHQHGKVRAKKNNAPLEKPPRRFESTSYMPNSSNIPRPPYAGTSGLVDNITFGGQVTAATRVSGKQPSASRNSELSTVSNTTTKVPSFKRRKREKHLQQQRTQTTGYQPQQQHQATNNTVRFLDKNTPEWVVALITSTNSNINSQLASLSTQLNSLSSQLTTHTANVESQLINANARISNLELQLAHYRSSGNNINSTSQVGSAFSRGNGTLNENVGNRKNGSDYDTNSGNDYDDSDEEDDDASYRQSII